MASAADKREHERPNRPMGPIDSGVVTINPKFTPTPSLHPGNVEALVDDWGNSDLRPLLQPVHTAFDTATAALKEIYDARIKAARNDAWTPSAQILNVSNFAEKRQAQVTQLFDSAMANLMKQEKALEDSLSAPMESAALGAMAQEIRSFARDLSSEDRNAFMLKAMRDADVRALQSVLGAPAYLSGIDPKMQKVWTRQYREQQAPEATKRLDVARKAIDLLGQRAPLFLGQVTEAFGASWATVGKLKKAASEAERALVLQQPGA